MPIRTDERTALATEAFFYGFPLVFNLTEVRRFFNEGIGDVPAMPFNEFGHAGELAGPEATFVSINNDTVYSIAQVDVSGGPVRLRVPDAGDRYYVLQFVDAWTNNFAYVGQRATGTAAGTYLLVAQDWDGVASDRERVIRLPTTVASIVGRWAVAGEADLPAVRALQAGLTLEPSGAGSGVPEPDDDGFFTQLRAWAQAFPPASRDVEYQRRFESLIDASDAELDAGLEQGRAQMEAALKNPDVPEQNGWRAAYHSFDYNLDFFEVGTLDDPAWKLPDDASRYVLRTLAARGGLWGNHGYEAAYAMTYVDGNGDELSGSGRYELRFDRTPPVGAFWSVTMYDLPEFYLVANPIDRYSIGDRTPGLVYGDGGALTITMQHEEPPDAEARANWLPTPDGPFRPILRMYMPGEPVFDGSYELPPIVRVG